MSAAVYFQKTREVRHHYLRAMSQSRKLKNMQSNFSCNSDPTNIGTYIIDVRLPNAFLIFGKTKKLSPLVFFLHSIVHSILRSFLFGNYSLYIKINSIFVRFSDENLKQFVTLFYARRSADLTLREQQS